MAKNKTLDLDQIASFIDELKTQSDRGAAIVAAAALEELTELVILARLIEISEERREALFDRMGAPLSSFSAKIEMAFALGTISNAARIKLHLIRDVRNRFAHRLEALTFDHPDVAQLIERRSTPATKAVKTPIKKRFLLMFQGMAITLYGTLAADIRIKSLKETHQAHFLQLMSKVSEIALKVYVEEVAKPFLQQPKSSDPKPN